MEVLKDKLNSVHIQSNILLGDCKLLNSSYRSTAEFNDPKYLPFYYHLGAQVKPKKVMQFGTKSGLIAACFLQGCKSVEDWVTVDKWDETTSSSVIESNIKKHNNGKTIICYNASFSSVLQELHNDHGHSCDLCFLTEKYPKDKMLEYLDLLWHSLKAEGLLVVDYINDDVVKAVFENFFRVKNRTPEVFKTRYGVGILTK